jgi:hypothetical protein
MADQTVNFRKPIVLDGPFYTKKNDSDRPLHVYIGNVLYAVLEPGKA